MHVNILGGGPAGLYFAILMKKQDPAHVITIFERDGPNDTFGWGIVFSDATLGNLKNYDEPSHAGISRICATWDNVDVLHRDAKVTIRGNKFTGTARLAFLNALQQRAAELGVEIRYHTNVAEAELERLADGDLFIAADGGNSLVRRNYADRFEPSVDVRRNKYIWLGTQRLFDGLTFIFRRSDAGWFVAHCYKFSATHSTFVIECSEETWARAGFAGMSDGESCGYLTQVFGRDLEGYPLLSNNFVRWLKFPIVRNRRWSFDHTVLLGDALHTAHFSIGSGTKLALEDAMALADGLRAGGSGRVADVLQQFEQARRPAIEKLQAIAESSLLWFENFERKMDLDPVPLAYELMTRSKRIDFAEVQRRDPGFAAAYQAVMRSSTEDADERR